MGECGMRDVDPGEWPVRVEVNVGQRRRGSGKIGLKYVDHSCNNLDSFMMVLEVEGFYVVDGVDENEGESVGKVGYRLE